MIIAANDLESDLRRLYNRRVFLCIRIKGAALLIGLWDIFIHTTALAILIFSFARPPETTSTVSPTNNDLHRRTSPIFIDPDDTLSSRVINNNKKLISNRIIFSSTSDKDNVNYPATNLNSKNFFSHWDLFTFSWIQSLSQKDKFLVFLVVLLATILTIMYMYGVVKNKAPYIIPYFLIKVFNVVIAILSMLGFYAYLPDIKIWLRMQANFPMKNYLLTFDAQTLQLLVFTFLLLVILIKLYVLAIIWYCYGYITTLTMARNIGVFTSLTDEQQTYNGQMYSPPKYEEAIKSTAEEHEDDSPPPYTPLLSS